jgi:signal transduction histidine kinase
VTTPPSSIQVTPSQRATFGAWQTPSWRWLAALTLDTRSYVGPLVVVQLMYIVSVGLIFTVALLDGDIDRSLLYLWLTESIANIVIRVSVLEWMRRHSLTDLMASRWWRFVPPTLSLIHGAHWAWTAVLFVSPDFTTVTLAVLLAFVLMTIACTIIMSMARASALIGVILIWVPTAVQLWPLPSVRHGVLVAVLLLSIGTILATTLYLSIRHVRRYFQKSDEVIRLVDQLWASNAELERMRAQAATELQNRSQFFHGASHDFAQRLHGLKLLAHVVQDSTPASPAALQKMSDALEDLEVYVRDVLEFARTEGSILTPSQRRTNLQDIFQQLLVHFESDAEARGVDLKIRATAAVVETDPAMLLRILENLVSNAIKFTRDRVLVAARTRATGCAIEIWDQGPGIPAQDRNAIFTAFYQHQVYVDRRREGVGLGLAIVHRLASALNYSVEMRSREGRGTVMTIHGLRRASEASKRPAETHEHVVIS